MQDIKYCERCCKKISDLNTSDWYSHISIKYCPDCAEKVRKEKTAARVKELRKRKKAKEKEQLEYIKLLEAENKNLRRLFLPTERGNDNEQTEAGTPGLQSAAHML